MPRNRMETAALESRKPHARSCVTNGDELFATKEPVDGRSMASRRFRDILAATSRTLVVPVANSIRLARDRESGDEIGACGTCSA